MKKLIPALITIVAFILFSFGSVPVAHPESGEDEQAETGESEDVSEEDQEIIKNLELLENLDFFIESDMEMIHNLEIFLSNS